LKAQKSYFLALLMALALTLLLNRGYFLHISKVPKISISWEILSLKELPASLPVSDLSRGLHVILERGFNGTPTFLESSNGILYPKEKLLIALNSSEPLKLTKVTELKGRWGKAIYFIFSKGRGNKLSLIRVSELNVTTPAILCLVKLGNGEMEFSEIARVVDPSKYLELKGVIKEGGRGVAGIPFKLLLSNSSSGVNFTKILDGVSGLKGSFLIRLPKGELMKRGKFLIISCKGKEEPVKLISNVTSYSVEVDL